MEEIHTGNLQKLGLVNTGDFFYNRAKGKFGFESHTKYAYNKTFGAVIENDLLTRALFYSRLQKRIYATVIFWYETNKQRQIMPLIQGGPSLEYVWLHQKNSTGGISLGATLEHKQFGAINFNHPQYNGSKYINTSRLFMRLHGSNILGKAKTNFLYDVYYMPSLKYSNNYRLHAESSLEVSVTNWLNLRTSINYNYESIVIMGVQPNDFSMDYGHSINF